MKRYFPIILSFLILVCPIFHIIACLFANRIIADSFVFLSIGLFFLVILLSLIKRIPYVVKMIISVVILIFVLAFNSLFYIVGGGDEFIIFENSSVEKFENTFFVCPDNYESATVYHKVNYSMFPHESKTLILKYDESDFVKAKSEITQNYQFYTEADFNGEILPEFEYAQFDFAICKSDKFFPKVIYFIGLNYNTCEIAFVCYNDLERDSVSAIDNVLSIDCGWEYIERSRNNNLFRLFYKEKI